MTTTDKMGGFFKSKQMVCTYTSQCTFKVTFEGYFIREIYYDTQSINLLEL